MWEVRAEHDDGPARSVWFPHVVTIETREAATAGPDRVETLTHLGFDAHGNPTGRRRRSFADGDPAVPEVVSEERTTYLDDETRWLVRLPVRVVALDADGVPFSVRVNRYGGPAFTGLLEGSATTGLVTVVSEARLLDARTPAGFLTGVDPAELGYVRVEGEAAGWFATTTSVRRDPAGNVVEQRDPLGASTLLAYDADGVFPISVTDPGGAVTDYEFEPRSGEPGGSPGSPTGGTVGRVRPPRPARRPVRAGRRRDRAADSKPGRCPPRPFRSRRRRRPGGPRRRRPSGPGHGRPDDASRGGHLGRPDLL